MATNKIVLGMVGALGLAVIVVGINALNKPDVNSTVNQPADNLQKAILPVSKTADGDTVAETIKTVKAGYDSTRSENDALKEDMKNVKADIEKLKISKQNPVSTSKTEIDPTVTELSNQLDEMKEGAKDFVQQFNAHKKFSGDKNARELSPYTTQPSTIALNGYEIDDAELGLTNTGESSATEKQKTGFLAQQRHFPGYVMVKPMTTESVNDFPRVSIKGAKDKAESLLHSLGNTAQETNHQLKGTMDDNRFNASMHLNIPNPKPYFTINKRATLVNAVAMTALIGTVPVGGKVNDPFPVKMIIGDDNLATNGLRIPGLRGIIFEGVARGNWNLSCVSVALTGATFTFDDGRIQHLGEDKDDHQSTPSEVSSPFNEGEGNHSLGYISNRRGVPCIPGKRVTDADKQLFTIGLLGAAKSHFDAKAAAQTTTQSGGLLGSSTSVTGDQAKFINNKTYADSVALMMDFYNKRMRDTFDVIYADPATPIVLHITKDLKVDYNTANRKLAYGFGGKYENALD